MHTHVCFLHKGCFAFVMKHCLEQSILLEKGWRSLEWWAIIARVSGSSSRWFEFAVGIMIRYNWSPISTEIVVRYGHRSWSSYVLRSIHSLSSIYLWFDWMCTSPPLPQQQTQQKFTCQVILTRISLKPIEKDKY